MVSGMLAGVPRQGGATWAVLQYVLGLRRLGHDVVLVEPVARFEETAVAYFHAVVRGFGLQDVAALLDAEGRTVGLTRRRLSEGADLLLNISGMLADEDLLARAGLRVFVDLDPAFTQLWCEAEGIDPGFDRHDRFVTVGQAIGRPGCAVPTCGRTWIGTPQPVVLAGWPVAGRVVHDAATTVGHWRAYGSIVHRGVHYGQKAHSMRALLRLTDRAPRDLLLALGIHPGERTDLEALRRHRWRLVDPDRVAGTPGAYRAFVQGSWAELGVAKQGYVASRCGWFSDRSVCYLASGRPVVAQDTGFTDWLPTGEGLLAFSTVEDAAAALEDVQGNYSRHRRAARMLAEDVFDSDRVLERLLACL
jgi:hypothetical protein